MGTVYFEVTRFSCRFALRHNTILPKRHHASMPLPPLLFAGVNAGHLDDAEQKHVGVSRMHKASAVLDVLRKACPRPRLIPAISVRRSHPPQVE